MSTPATDSLTIRHESVELDDYELTSDELLKMNSSELQPMTRTTGHSPSTSSLMDLHRKSPNLYKERIKSVLIGALTMVFLFSTYNLYHKYNTPVAATSTTSMISSVPVQPIYQRDPNISLLLDEIRHLKQITTDLQAKIEKKNTFTNTPSNPLLNTNTNNIATSISTSTTTPTSTTPAITTTVPVTTTTTGTPTTTTTTTTTPSPVTPTTPTTTTPTTTTLTTTTPTTTPTTTTPTTTPTTTTPTTTTPTTTTPSSSLSPPSTSFVDTNTVFTTLPPSNLPTTHLPGPSLAVLDTELPSPPPGYQRPEPASPLTQVQADYHKSRFLTEWTKYKQKVVENTQRIPVKDRVHGDSPFLHQDFHKTSHVLGATIQKTDFLDTDAPFPAAPRPVDPSTAARRDFITKQIKHAWDGYSAICWGQDELMPVSNRCHQWLGMGITIIDSLSTLWIAGLHTEYNKAVEWVTDKLDIISYQGDISFFETTIRILGGLMSAYDLSGDERLVFKAMAVANALHIAYTEHGLPHSLIHFRTFRRHGFGWAGGAHILAEIGTIQIENMALTHSFKKIYSKVRKSEARSKVKFANQSPDAIKETLRLTRYNTIDSSVIYDSPLHIDGNTPYFDLAHGVFDILNKMSKPKGLYPTYISTTPPYRFTNSQATMGGLGDSYYEYLLKMWIATGRKHEMYRKMYLEAMDGVLKLQYAELGGTGYIGTYDYSRSMTMDHLSCFSGGMLALGVHVGAVTDPILAGMHMRAAQQVTRTCTMGYMSTKTGLGPDNLRIDRNGQVSSANANYYQRPETVESLFILWRTTKDPIYREWGWNIVQSLELATKRTHGYTTVSNVGVLNAVNDKQETFLLAETLKYLYLLFSDDNAMDLTQWVFNTEAHPIKARNVELPTDAAVKDARDWVKLRVQQLTPENARQIV